MITAKRLEIVIDNLYCDAIIIMVANFPIVTVIGPQGRNHLNPGRGYQGAYTRDGKVINLSSSEYFGGEIVFCDTKAKAAQTIADQLNYLNGGKGKRK